MRQLYTVILYVLVPFVLVRLFWRGLRNPGYWHRIGERFGIVERAAGELVIWVHAVSVGEVRATVPLIQSLAEKYPEHKILVTTMTPTGSDQVRRLFGAAVDHCYIPYDLPVAVGRFLDKKRPSVALIMETEIWPNVFHMCRVRNIPVIITNARLSQRSMRGYKRFSGLARSTLAQVHCIGAQSRNDAERFTELGAPEKAVEVTGSIKFDLKLPASLFETADMLRHQWGTSRGVWLAASTHEGEEEIILNAFAELKKIFPDLLLVIAPRHPERFIPVANFCKRSGFTVVLRSEQQNSIEGEVDILVGDTMGELQLFYAAADVAFVGGSLVPVGGHNILEPAAVGAPFIFGPYMFNFSEISAKALEYDAGIQIEGAAMLVSAVSKYINDPNLRHEAGESGKRMVADNRGALERTLDLMEQVISNTII